MLSSSLASSSQSTELVHKEPKKQTLFEVGKDNKKMKLYLPDGGRVSERLSVIGLPTVFIANHKFNDLLYCREIPYLIKERPGKLYKIDFSFIGAILDHPSWLFQHRFHRGEYEGNKGAFVEIIDAMFDMRVDIDIVTKRAFRDNLLKEFIEKGYTFRFLSNDGKTSISKPLVTDDMIVFLTEKLYLFIQTGIVGFTLGLIQREGPEVMSRVVSIKLSDIIPKFETIQFIIEYIKASDGAVRELQIHNEESKVSIYLDYILQEIYNLNHNFYILDISKCDLTPQNFNELGRFLRENKRLHKIKMSGFRMEMNHINAFKTAFLGQIPIQNTTLVNLALKTLSISSELLFELSKCFEHMNLRYLSLNDNFILVDNDEIDRPHQPHRMSTDGISGLFNVLTKDKIVSLDLSKNISVGGTKFVAFYDHIAQWMENNLTIRSLKLKNNFIEGYEEDEEEEVIDNEIFAKFIRRLTKYSVQDKNRLEKLNMRENQIMTEMGDDYPIRFDKLIKKSRYIRKIRLDSTTGERVKNVQYQPMIYDLLMYNYNMERLDLNDLTPIAGVTPFEYFLVKERELNNRILSLFMLKEFCLRRNRRMVKSMTQRLLTSLQVELGVKIPEDEAYHQTMGISPYTYQFREMRFTNVILCHIIDDIPDYMTPFRLQLSNMQDSNVYTSPSDKEFWIRKLAYKFTSKGMNRYLTSLAIDEFMLVDDDIHRLIKSLYFKIDNPLLSGLPPDVEFGNDVLETLYLRNNRYLPTAYFLPLLGDLIMKSRIKTFVLYFGYHINFYDTERKQNFEYNILEMMDLIKKSAHLTGFGISFKTLLNTDYEFANQFMVKLIQCQHIQNLTFESTNFQNLHHFDDTFKFIIQMPNLIGLDLLNIMIDPKQLKQIASFINKSNLRSFTISFAGLDDEFTTPHADFVKFVDVISKNRKLTSINIPQIVGKLKEKITATEERNKNLKLQNISLEDDIEEMTNPMPKRSSGAKKHNPSYDMDYITKITYYIDLLIYNERFVRNDVQRQKLKKVYNLLLSELYTFTKSSRTNADYHIFHKHTSYIIDHHLANYRKKYTLFHK